MNQARQPARRFLPSLVVVALGVAVTTGVFATLRELEGTSAHAAFENVARERLDALETNIAVTIDNLIAVEALYEASPRFDRVAFARFAAPLLAKNRAIQALEWIPRVPRSQRSRYETAGRNDGYPNFQFTEHLDNGAMARAGDRDDYFPVFFVEPFAGNERALGFDLASNPARREALQRAGATGRLIATSRVILVQEKANQYGALVFYPVYRGGVKSPTEQARREALTGFALGVFRIQDIVEKTGTIPNPASGLRVAIFDREAKPGEHLLYPKGAGFDGVEDLPPGFRTTRAVPVAGRTWEVAVYPVDGAFQASRWSSWAVLATGLLLTVFLTSYLAERRTSEEALQRSEERSRLLFATIPIPVWVYDLESLAFLEVNEAATTHYGYTRDAFLRMRITDIRPPEELERLARNLQQARPVRQFSTGWKHRTQDGRIIEVEISSHTLNYDGRPAALVVAQDVTARRRLEVELRHSQKLEAVGSLAAGIAHEINTPIQFVGDNMRFLQDAFTSLASLIAEYQQLRDAAARGDANADLAHHLADAEQAADLAFLQEEIPKAVTQSLDGVKRVATIVTAMKEFAHPNPDKKAATDLNKSLQSTLIVARNEIKYVAEVKIDLQELPLVQCNGSDMNQVFLNLLINAAHAIKDRGLAEGQKGVISVRTRLDDDDVVVSVSDTGCGIPEDIRDKIFEPFFTTKQVGRGTGQGLAIARKIVVENHGGSLTFDTKVGQGTTFYVRLPARAEPPISSSPVAASIATS